MIILPSAYSTPLPLFIDLGFAIATETHSAMSNGSDITLFKLLPNKSLSCVEVNNLSFSDPTIYFFVTLTNNPDFYDKSVVTRSE